MLVNLNIVLLECKLANLELTLFIIILKPFFFNISGPVFTKILILRIVLFLEFFLELSFFLEKF